jgi:hypothetical protein
MTTKLINPISRISVGEYSGSGKGLRPIKITLKQGDLICMSYKGMHTEYCADIGSVMTWIQAKTAGVSTEPRKKRTNL